MDTADASTADLARTVNLARQVERHVAAYLAAFATGSATELDHLYEDHAVVVPQPGLAMGGPDRLVANGRLLDLGLTMEATTRHTYVVDDIALLIIDWSMSGTGPDGHPLDLSGTATDVARRGSDGRWRYLIDNPFGGAKPEASP